VIIAEGGFLALGSGELRFCYPLTTDHYPLLHWRRVRLDGVEENEEPQRHQEHREKSLQQPFASHGRLDAGFSQQWPEKNKSVPSGVPKGLSSCDASQNPHPAKPSRVWRPAAFLAGWMELTVALQGRTV
jgi:hypothetical protein